MILRLRPWLIVAALLVVSHAIAGVCDAEIVFLTSGRTLSVKSHRAAGPTMVLTLRGGGEITCDATLVERIEPDEVPHPEPQAAVIPAALPGGPRPYAELIELAAVREGVDPRLVHAVIQVESAYQPKARSRKGAMGLMQLMPGTARQYAVADPYDPGTNITAGIKHLKSLLERFDVKLALAAYNAGEAAVERFRGVPPYPETQNYVRQVLRIASGR
jgi:hypothetical protein